MSTTRFLGASIARMNGSVMEQLLTMRRAIAPFNIARDLRTALLYTGGWFIQWHEGPPDAIDRTWGISLSHTTHHHARVVHRSCGAASLRAPIEIAALAGHDKPTDVARKLYQIEHEQRRAALEPADLWRRLAAPAGAVAPLRTLVLIGESGEAVELLKSLAERGRLPVYYQRFASSDLRTADAGAAYMDLPLRGARVRAHAFSRLVPAIGVARLCLPQVDAVVLLARRGPDAAAILFESVAPLLAGTGELPRVHVVRAATPDAVLPIAAALASAL